MDTKIFVMGLGAGSIDALTVRAYQLLKAGYPIFLRTERHPVVQLLHDENILYECFDAIYDQADNFDEVYETIVSKLMAFAQESQSPIVYAVPGHPMVAERSVKLLRAQSEKSGIPLEIISSSSFLDDMFSALSVDPNEGFLLLDGLDFDETKLDSRFHTIITQVYSPQVASDVKLVLMDYYPENTEVAVIRGAGVQGLEQVWRVPIYEMDRIQEIDHLTAVYIAPGNDKEQNKSFGKLVDIVKRLRGPGGCPWDQEQTHESIRSYLIEETYEVLEALDSGDMEHFAEELGDLLLHVVMHAQIAKDEGNFSIFQVVESISEKMIRRHPHVFHETMVGNVEDVLHNWDEIKKKEKQKKDGEKAPSVLDGIPKGLPMLMYSYKQQKKAAKVGFDWDQEEQVWEKVEEELNELRLAKGEERADELGDVLYAIVNLARFMKIDPEDALHRTCLKFSQRFQYIEQKLEEKGLEFSEVSLDWMEEQWQKAKKI
ncbi:nucleoside triphosphate pyrophosphohydrolase [Desulfuribacillus stibiiarsenatis]|uniref:Nucleoside triphosphate pyrophosphohydrolase n=1 Tax=Desulfuribacillus stibiiarsenatis TaxID=1390249 RepID=A0A1E5L2I0_9FIRM|nr:nucleoside triphosphate pyrophosphohydrolase [Desulfuribacillus stibiiarsenatis]OEH84345.1 nucleoside triphosphate pyrophosphohydrolase [Desulfuribacillus stibiiarsenatis]